MWNDDRSLLLSRVCVTVFLIVLAATAVFAPWLVARTFGNTDMAGSETLVLITVYTGCIPAAFLLTRLYILLRRIAQGEVFVPQNVEALRHISWCCFAGAIICAVSVIYYMPWVFVAVAAGFVGLIVRVVKNVFARAVALQDDADHTI
ncbi:DUF2975 domain-containing protein [Oscillospiraceae bacterium CM]|nr:DUF2975 domain-containing protein [Oscillospiraceae bacterium CM]